MEQFKKFDTVKVVKDRWGIMGFIGKVGKIMEVEVTECSEYGVQFFNYDGLRWFLPSEIELVSNSSELKLLSETLEKRNARIAELEAFNNDLNKEIREKNTVLAYWKDRAQETNGATNLITNGPFGTPNITSIVNGFTKSLAEKEKEIAKLETELKKFKDGDSNSKIGDEVVITCKGSFVNGSNGTITGIHGDSATVQLNSPHILVFISKKDLKKV